MAAQDETQQVEGDQSKMQIHVPHEEVSTVTRLEMKQRDFFNKLRHYDDEAKFELALDGGKLTFKSSTDIFNAVICRGKAHVLGVYGLFPEASGNKKTSETADDKSNEHAQSMVHHWTWPWAKIPQLQTQEAENKEAENKEAENKEAENKEAENKEAENKEAETQEAENKEAENKESETQESENKVETLISRYNGEKDLEQKIRSTERETMQQLMKAEHVFLSDAMVITYIQAVLHEEMKLDFIHTIPLGDDAFISFGITDLTWTTDDEFRMLGAIESDVVVSTDSEDVYD